MAVCLLWAALALAVLALLRRTRPAAPDSALPHLTSLLGAGTVGLVIVSAGVRPTGQPHSLLLAAVSLAAIGVACAGSVGWLSRVAGPVRRLTPAGRASPPGPFCRRTDVRARWSANRRPQRPSSPTHGHEVGLAGAHG